MQRGVLLISMLAAPPRVQDSKLLMHHGIHVHVINGVKGARRCIISVLRDHSYMYMSVDKHAMPRVALTNDDWIGSNGSREEKIQI